VIDPRLARRLFVVWLLSALVLTLSPFVGRAAPRGFGWGAHPFDLIANILFFVPCGVFLVQGGMRKRAALVMAALITLGIESAQAWIAMRHPSYNDLALNAVGGAAGAYLSRPLVQLGQRFDRAWLRYVALATGTIVAAVILEVWPPIRTYDPLFPFALATLGALVASGLWRPWMVFGLTTAAVLVVYGNSPAVAAAGAALGTWPAMGKMAARTQRVAA